MDLPTATPCEQTAEYLKTVKDPTVLSLEVLEQSLRIFSKDANAMLQQLGIWQRELRDAEFDETNSDLKPRIHNCDQRQLAMADNVAELTKVLQRMRKNIIDLRGDQAELVRCSIVTEKDAPPTV